MTITENKSLAELATFRIGGSARYFCDVKTEQELLDALSFAKEKKIPFFILGGGSNILISDKGFNGLVIKMQLKGMEYIPDLNGNEKIIVQAGENWDDFVAESVKRGLYGIENLSYIPGTVGAAPVQNIGAYGSEVNDTIESVRIYDAKSESFKNVLNIDCHFSYRNSLFKKEKGRYVIVSVTFILSKSGEVNIDYKDLKEYFDKKGTAHPTLSEVRDAVIEIRTQKLPDVRLVGTAGSFFKNAIITHVKAHELKSLYPEMPFFVVNDAEVKVPTAWILDHICGYKGASKGNVGTYKNQALVLVNNGNATAREVKDFADELMQSVKEKTGIVIEPEVEYVGN